MEEPAREAGGATTAMKIYYVADRVPWPREKMGQDKSAQRTQDWLQVSTPAKHSHVLTVIYELLLRILIQTKQTHE